MCGSFATVTFTETGRMEVKTQTEKLALILSNCHFCQCGN